MLNSSPAPQARPAVETQAGAISRNPRLPTHLQYDGTRVLQNVCATRRNGNRNHLFDFFLAFPPGSGNIVPVENGLVAREVLWPLHAPDLFTMRFHVCGACIAHPALVAPQYNSVYQKCRPTFQLLVVFTLPSSCEWLPLMTRTLRKVLEKPVGPSSYLTENNSRAAAERSGRCSSRFSGPADAGVSLLSRAGTHILLDNMHTYFSPGHQTGPVNGWLSCQDRWNYTDEC